MIEFKPAYYRYHEIVDLLEQWVANYPTLCQLESIGKSFEGRDIYVLTVTNNKKGSSSEKAGMYIEANMHAGEVTGSAVVLYTIDFLLKNYSYDNEITKLVDDYTFYFNPRVSPDGAELYLTTPHILRSSVRHYPNADKQTGFLYPEDIDRDGLILQMRVADKNGRYKVSDKDERLMIPRQAKDQTGPFYNLYREGIVHGGKDISGNLTEKTLWGLDFNRNYPANWAPESQQRGAGPYPLSELETRAVADFLVSRANIAGAMSYHTSGGCILRPYSTKKDTNMLPADKDFYQMFEEIAEQETSYPLIDVFYGLSNSRPSYGDFKDWVFEHLGVYVFTTELWDMYKVAGISRNWKSPESRDRKTVEEKEQDQLALLKWNDDDLDGDGFVEWTPFNHPQLGPVELGGWKYKTVRQNPPLKYLSDECHKNMRFTLRHTSFLPKLTISQAKAKHIRNGLYKVEAKVTNDKYLPTNVSQQAIALSIDVGVKAWLEGAVQILSTENELSLGNISGFGQQKVEWLIEAQSGTHITINAQSPKAGKAAATLLLGE